ncbi:hypothetical protein B9G54_07650 [Alloscardovia macacae]|uniref:Uncharacterized protein n=1 Tax=Alloscardovia macacae TaxID=1160091 RepID=A0A1Y2SSA9_9BIFI|nr:hypothetical protein [Alloscardovia macacae]OTA25453.1 hypothetical protein B9G54_07650 [Alloscardovia macacae]OTA29336.1 hypothetical protein B9T39_04310 [Alloscardovia macacae]
MKINVITQFIAGILTVTLGILSILLYRHILFGALVITAGIFNILTGCIEWEGEKRKKRSQKKD